MERRFIRWLLAHQEIGLAHLWRSATSLIIPPWSVPGFKANKAYLRGELCDHMQSLGVACVTECIRPALRPAAIEAINHHRQQQHRIILLTGSLDLLATPLAEQLGIAESISGRLEHHDQRFTGRIVSPHPYGRQKRKALDDYAQQQGIDLRHAYLYTDCPSDLPSLEQVGHPIVINPQAPLDQLARKRGWIVAHWHDPS